MRTNNYFHGGVIQNWIGTVIGIAGVFTAVLDCVYLYHNYQAHLGVQ